MRAAVLHEVGGRLTVEDALAAPAPTRTQVRVAIEASGVCHSDLSVATGAVPGEFPLILGHEAVGTVTEVGASVRGLAIGDRVILAFTPVCGSCWYCVRGMTHLCTAERDQVEIYDGRGTIYSRLAGLGAFADEVIAMESMTIKVDTGLPAEQLALIGCAVATGVGAALNTAGVIPGSSAVVFGCGGIGQAIIQGCRIAGAATIVAVDPVAMKRETARAMGAVGVDPAVGDPLEQVRELTGGRGADYAFEATGIPAMLLQAYDAARRGGTVVAVGMPATGSTIEFPVDGFYRSEKRLLGCSYGSCQVKRDFPRLIELAESGRLDLASMVSRQIGLEDANEAFAAMRAGESIRSVIMMDGHPGR